jgi:hypothetical protein
VRDENRLALVPIAVALMLGLLLLPRRATPEAVPLPAPDLHQLAREAEADRELAERARREPLSGSLRALGSAIREFHALEARGAEERELGAARRIVDAALPEAAGAGDDAMLLLRAAQLDGFLAEIRRFEATGEQSPELGALAGGFIRTMRTEGWCDGHTLAAGDAALRAMYKQMWNAFIGFEDHDGFEVPLDQQRALYALYLSRPHPAQAMRGRLAAARRGARDAQACQHVADTERSAIEAWRLERIVRLSAIDPNYPGAYARGVVSFRRGDYAGSVAAFRAWVSDHPDGPLALRAQSYLRAAIDADRAE